MRRILTAASALIAAVAMVGDGPWGVSVGPGHIAVTDTAADTVHLLDRDTLAVRDVVTVGAGPWNSTFLGGTLYVTLERAGAVAAVRAAKVVWRTPVGASPHGIVADRERNTVLAGVTGTSRVAVLDARTGVVVDRIAVAAGPAGIALDPQTGRVFDLLTAFDPNAFPSSTIAILGTATLAYQHGTHAGEAFNLAIRDALLERERAIGDPSVLAGVAGDHGLSVPDEAAACAAVDADFAEGCQRGVTGSPYFIVDGSPFFCPTLDIERRGAHLHIDIDDAGLDQFIDRALQ